MGVIEVRIPGKVMLSGEYAVLHGGTAVLMPVPRYLTVREATSSSDLPSSPVWQEALNEPIEEIASWEETHPLRHLNIDRSAFTMTRPDGTNAKLGLGSSAAEAVGIIALRFERAGMDWTTQRERVAILAEKAHRRAQGGIGSGADVAVIAHGGPIRFRRTDSGFEAVPISGPPTLPLHLLWSGQPADTRVLVRQFEEWRTSGERASRMVDRLLEASDLLASYWFGSTTDDLLEALDEFCDRMLACAEAAGMPWQLPLHRELNEWAVSHGGRAKPTGAGGGDLVLLAGDLPLDNRSEVGIPLG